MTEATQQSDVAKRQARHREGVSHQLKAIRSAVEDLQADMKQVLATRLIRKSLTQDDKHAD